MELHMAPPGHERLDKLHGRRNETILLSGCIYQYFRYTARAVSFCLAIS